MLLCDRFNNLVVRGLIMAKYECTVKADFSRLISVIENGILEDSVSANLEDVSQFIIGDVRCAVLVFERYSIIGQNRVSLNVTLFGNNDQIKISAITSGGSQATFFKLNTIGEESFLDSFISVLNNNI